MKRIFFAVDVPAMAKAAGGKHVEDLKRTFADVRVSWVKRENLHVTAKFVGDVEESRIATITSLANASAHIRRFILGISSPSAFGKRVLSLTVDDESDSLVAANEIMEAACERAGFAREERSFRPHLTLARIRDEKGTGDLISAHTQKPVEPVEWEVREIVLYESELHPTGSIYTRLATFPLGG